MMEFIRRKLRFLMWFVAISFVGGLFFIGGRTIGQNWLVNVLPVSLLVMMPGCARSAGIIMKVGDYSVKIDEFKRVKENSIENARRRYGENFDTYARNIDFDRETIESITRYALLLEEADRRNIYISKGELQEGIREFPYQMPDEVGSRVKPVMYYSWSKGRDGTFNPNLYRFLLAREGKITPEEFSKEVENGLRIARLKDALTESTLVTDPEIQQEYRKQNEKAKIKSVELRYGDFTSKVEIDDAELSDFFQENMLDYKTSDKVNISFIKIDPKGFEDEIKISDAEVESYYKAHREEDYFEPEKVKARHIFVKVDPAASDEDKAKAKAYAEEILKEAKKPDADFPALAGKYAKEPLEVEHEDLGFFERGKMVRPFEEAAFALSPDEVSDVVETSFGYHIIKVEDKKPSQTKPLEEVKDEIIKKLKAEEAKVEARQKADDVQYTIMSEEDLQAAVDANPDLNLKVEETGLFAKNEFIPKIGSGYTYRDVAEEAFKLKVGEISDLVEVRSYGDRILGYFIFKLTDKKSGGLPKLDDVKDNVTKDLKDEKARKLAMEGAKKIMAARGPNDDLDKIVERAGKDDLKISESEPFAFSARGYIRGKPTSIDSKDVMLRAFSMDIGEIAGPFEGANGVYIIQLVEREKFDEEKFAEDEEERSKLRNQLLRQKQRKIYDTWYQKVRNEAVIRSF